MTKKKHLSPTWTYSSVSLSVRPRNMHSFLNSPDDTNIPRFGNFRHMWNLKAFIFHCLFFLILLRRINNFKWINLYSYSPMCTGTKSCPWVKQLLLKPILQNSWDNHLPVQCTSPWVSKDSQYLILSQNIFYIPSYLVITSKYLQ